LGIGNASQFEQRVTKWVTCDRRMILDQIIQDERARLSMKENDLFDEWVPSKWNLFQIVCPRRCVSQDAGEFQVPLFQCKRQEFRCPQLRIGEIARAILPVAKRASESQPQDI
jgi:hypothetical protein